MSNRKKLSAFRADCTTVGQSERFREYHVPSIAICKFSIVAVALLTSATACHGIASDFSSELTRVGLEQIAVLPDDPDNVTRGGALHPNQPIVAILTHRYQIKIWDYAGKRVLTTLSTPSGASDVSTSTPLLFSPDGQYLIACLTRGQKNVIVRVWRTDTWQVAHEIVDDKPTGGCQAAVIGNAGILYYVSGRSLTPRIAAVETVTWTQQWANESIPHNIRSLALNPNSSELYAAASGGIDVKAIMNTADRIYKRSSGLLFRLAQKTGEVTWSGNLSLPVGLYSDMTITTDGKQLAIAHGDGYAIYDIATGQIRADHAPTISTVRTNIIFGPTGRTLYQAVRGERGVLRWSSLKTENLGEMKNSYTYLALGKSGNVALGLKSTTIIARIR